MGSRDETYAAIRKTLALLDDPFTRLLEPKRYAALKDGNKGAVTGVGLEVGSGPDGKGLVVSASSITLSSYSLCDCKARCLTTAPRWRSRASGWKWAPEQMARRSW